MALRGEMTRTPVRWDAVFAAPNRLFRRISEVKTNVLTHRWRDVGYLAGQPPVPLLDLAGRPPPPRWAPPIRVRAIERTGQPAGSGGRTASVRAVQPARPMMP